MAESTRAITWRQGHILGSEATKFFGFVETEDLGKAFAIVISHDCDLAAEEKKEPEVEIIVGWKIAKLGDASYAKTSRRLQLVFLDSDGKELVLELNAPNKCSIPKSELFKFSRDERLTLPSKGLGILQTWLAARYRRAAFPEAFETRFRPSKGYHEIEMHDEISKILTKGGKWIRGLLFDLDEGNNIERVPTDVYKLRIVVLYVGNPDEESAYSAALEACQALENLFGRAFENETGEVQGISLESCDPVSDESMSVSQRDNLKPWQLDYLSLKSDPPEAMLGSGI